MRTISVLAALLLVAPAAAQVEEDGRNPDSPAMQQAARMALPNAQIRRIAIEVRTIQGLNATAAAAARTISGEATSLAGVAQTLQVGGLQTRMVNGGLEVSLPGDVLFDFDKASIRQSAVPTLEKVAAAARATGERPIRVEGHTDAVGTPDYNGRLSVARAEAVAGWLRGAGIAPGRIASAGFGATRPVAPNRTQAGADDPAGRQRNRRVTVTFGG